MITEKSSTLPLPQLWLASQSPRRRQLLETLGLAFTVRSSDAPEAEPDASHVDEVTVSNALLKASVVQAGLEDPLGVVIAADTLVVHGDEVISKPENAARVIATLKKFSGSTHVVVTGLVLLSKEFGVRKACVKTTIRFRTLSDTEIENYAKTREPYDKAGAYAVQGLGTLFIERMDGSFSNAMGLPVETVLRELESLTQIPLYRWFL